MSAPVVGTAGWAIPRLSAERMPTEGTHLQRYAGVLRGVEINSSFYRPHRAATYQRWAAATPADFRFAVKMPRAVTHGGLTHDVADALATFRGECAGLGDKLGPLLIQLPPSQAFDRAVADRFFAQIREHFRGTIVCEPRHATWLTAPAEELLIEHHVGRVAADPARSPGFEQAGGWRGITYFRLHGSPRTYWSSYSTARLGAFAAASIAESSADRWIIFDNTASGAALANALDMRDMVRGPATPTA